MILHFVKQNLLKTVLGAFCFAFVITSHTDVQAQSSRGSRSGFHAGSKNIRVGKPITPSAARHFATGQHAYFGTIRRSTGNPHYSYRSGISRNRNFGIGSFGLGFPHPNPYFYGYGVIPGTYNRFGYYSYQNQIPLFAAYPPVYYRQSDLQASPAPRAPQSQPQTYSGPMVIENPFYVSPEEKKSSASKRRSSKTNRRTKKSSKTKSESTSRSKKKPQKSKLEMEKQKASKAAEEALKKAEKEIKQVANLRIQYQSRGRSGVIISNPYYKPSKRRTVRQNNLL